MRKRKQGSANKWALLSILLLSLVLAACGTGEAADNGVTGGQGDVGVQSGIGGANDGLDSAGQAEGAGVESGSGDAAQGFNTVYPVTVTDDAGETLTLDHAPQRIVSMSPSETEILFALGLGDRIVAVSDYDNYPAEALDKPKIGGTWDPNVEAVLSHEPDLVIGGMSMMKESYEQFRSLGLPIYVARPKTLDAVMETILTFGTLTDTRERAEAIVSGMREDIRLVTEAAATIPEGERKKVYVEFAPGWTVGSGEFLDELIRIAGGINVAGEQTGWVQVSEEHVVASNPDVILYAADLIDYDTGKPLEELIRNRSGWGDVTAILENRLVPLNEDIVSRTGPRITQALRQVAEAIYPGMLNP